MLKVPLTRNHFSLMSGITPGGHLMTRMRAQAMTGLDSTDFLLQVGRYLGGKLLVIWDGGSIHRGEEIILFMSNGGSEFVHLESFPAYAPDLNPDEGVWNHLKNVELGNLCCTSFPSLHKEINLGIRRMRRRPDLIKSFYAQAGLEL